MPDWQELVRKRLAGLELDTTEREEVQTELAAHLEDSYETLRKQGLFEREAVDRTLDQVSDWRELQRRIFAAKRREYPMKKRTKQLWIPGFLTWIFSILSLAILLKVGFRPRIVGIGPSAILFYGPWLASLPFFGALAAYLSRQAGGSRGTMLIASVFPVLALTAAFLLMFPIDLIAGWIIGRQVDFSVVATALLSEGLGWLVVPGAAFLMGGLLSQLMFGRRSSPQDQAVGRESIDA